MANLISVLSNLRKLTFHFESPQPRPDRESQSLPPSKRFILPALHNLFFEGATKYLEDFLDRIDAPQLDIIHITFLNQINLDCPQLAQFINCTPKLRHTRQSLCPSVGWWARTCSRIQFGVVFPLSSLCASRLRTPFFPLSIFSLHKHGRTQFVFENAVRTGPTKRHIKDALQIETSHSGNMHQSHLRHKRTA